MNREQILLRHIDKSGMGIEIGPSHAPIAPKANGYNVRIIDHLSKADLIRKYSAHGIDVSRIEEVDYVSTGGSYAELIGSSGTFDWIIASNVIEHTPDLISFLQDCQALLTANGVISLAIPDKRYCFDHFRSLSDISKVIDAYLNKRKYHPAGAVADYFLNVVSLDQQGVWAEGAKGELRSIHSLQDAERGIKTMVEGDVYLDIHAWCFTPTSFRLMLRDLNDLGYIGLHETDFAVPGGFEFFTTLSKGGSLIQGPRIDILKQIERELWQATSFIGEVDPVGCTGEPVD